VLAVSTISSAASAGRGGMAAVAPRATTRASQSRPVSLIGSVGERFIAVLNGR
jgi:hypothetical protein